MHADPKIMMIEAQAADWLISQRDPSFADWDGFADWLARDPQHAEIYDALASLDQDLDNLPRPRKAVHRADAEPPMPYRPTRRMWFGGAIAAALVGAITLSSLPGNANRIETAAGEHRSIDLADGSRIEINGGSVVELDSDRPRFARLESGEAMFHVVHRDDDPFVVVAGDSRIVDLGTAFNVIRAQDRTSVAVSEGLVVFNPGRDDVRVSAGHAIDARDDAGAPPTVRAIDGASVGGWRSGLLVYNGAPLSIVAEDLRRTAGISVTIAPAVSTLPFRGALIIDKDAGRTIADLAALSGTRAERRGDEWVIDR